MVQGYQALTDKEKQTLRLLLDGHDAKSLARHFGLSVHTINERLRDARRKLSVSSSREAARLLRQAEGAAPEMSGDATFGDAAAAPPDQETAQPGRGAWPLSRNVRAIGGFAMISLFVALLALSVPAERPTAVTQTPNATAAATETAAGKAARDWLALLDRSDWQASWAATGASFRSLNTVAAWQAASEQARLPLGPVLSRTLLSEQDVPAPPAGYTMVRFRTDFANRKGAIETLSLDREGGSWKVVGIYIE